MNKSRFHNFVIMLILLLTVGCGAPTAEPVPESAAESKTAAENNTDTLTPEPPADASEDFFDEDYGDYAGAESDTFFEDDYYTSGYFEDDQRPDYDTNDDGDYEDYYATDTPTQDNAKQEQPESESEPDTSVSAKDTESPPPAQAYRTYSSIKELENTKHFNKHALEHIFYGQVNSRGKATGYHTESIPNEHGSVISGTESAPDENGVYEAKVQVNGKKKSGNNGRSTLYPKAWDAQQVVDAINEAYDNRVFVKGSDNVYRGTANGITIEMYLTDNEKIISAFPVLGE